MGLLVSLVPPSSVLPKILQGRIQNHRRHHLLRAAFVVILAFLPVFILHQMPHRNFYQSHQNHRSWPLPFPPTSAYVFNWVLNWDMINNWFGDGWFGFILLLLIAAIVSWVLTKK